MILRDDVALITGSTKGMGKAIAERFVREGARVVITGRTVEDGRQVEHELRAAGHEARFVRMDAAQEQEVVAAVGAAVDTFGKLTILVNNAAPTELTVGEDRVDDTVAAVTTEAWDQIFDATLKGPFWGCKYAIPEIARAGGGAIVNVSSLAAMLGFGGASAYAAAKAGLHALTRSVAVECAEMNIRSNCIVPGAVPTRFTAFLEDAEFVAALRSLQLTRLGVPEDIANTALFLASKESEFITGVVLPVDGGASCKMPLPSVGAAYDKT